MSYVSNASKSSPWKVFLNVSKLYECVYVWVCDQSFFYWWRKGTFYHEGIFPTRIGNHVVNKEPGLIVQFSRRRNISIFMWFYLEIPPIMAISKIALYIFWWSFIRMLFNFPGKLSRWHFSSNKVHKISFTPCTFNL